MLTAAFIVRNPGYSFRHVRELPIVRRAMKAHLIAYPRCAWCGGEAGVEVHHRVPVHVCPHLAADPLNMVSLCRPRRCHLVIGHAGNYRQHVRGLGRVIEAHRVIEG